LDIVYPATNTAACNAKRRLANEGSLQRYSNHLP